MQPTAPSLQRAKKKHHANNTVTIPNPLIAFVEMLMSDSYARLFSR
jgi:hypothetical protein